MIIYYAKPPILCQLEAAVTHCDRCSQQQLAFAGAQHDDAKCFSTFNRRFINVASGHLYMGSAIT